MSLLPPDLMSVTSLMCEADDGESSGGGGSYDCVVVGSVKKTKRQEVLLLGRASEAPRQVKNPQVATLEPHADTHEQEPHADTHVLEPHAHTHAATLEPHVGVWTTLDTRVGAPQHKKPQLQPEPQAGHVVDILK